MDTIQQLQCSIPGCLWTEDNTRRGEINTRTLYKIPRNEQVAKSILLQAGFDEREKVSSQFRICSHHFTKQSFIKIGERFHLSQRPVFIPPNEIARCSIQNCQQPSDSTTTLFPAPENEKMRSIWKKVLEMPQGFMNDFSICERHFMKESVQIEKTLKPKVVPCQNLEKNAKWGSICRVCKVNFLHAEISNTSIYRDVFHKFIGCELPTGNICPRCIDQLNNFTVFRSYIQQKHGISSKPKLRTPEKIEIDDIVEVKEEPFYPEQFIITEIKSDPQEINIYSQDQQEALNAFLNEKYFNVENEEMCSANSQNLQTSGKVIKASNFFEDIPPEHQSSKSTVSVANKSGSRFIKNSDPRKFGFKCDFCMNRFVEPTFVREHIKQKHSFKCLLCEKIFPFRISLIKHEVSKHAFPKSQSLPKLKNKTDQLHQTTTSNVVKLKRNLLKDRLLAEEVKLPAMSIPCLDCGIRLHPLDLFAHRIQYHSSGTNKTMFTCDLCGEKIYGFLELKTHMEENHKAGNETFKCSKCGKVFDTLVLYTKHENNRHNREVHCNFCNMRFKGKDEILKHIRLHHRKKQVFVPLEDSDEEDFFSFEPEIEENATSFKNS